jgi:hypothetical protein
MLKKLIKKEKAKSKRPHSKKHGKNKKIVKKKIEDNVPLTKTERESKVFAKVRKNTKAKLKK